MRVTWFTENKQIIEKDNWTIQNENVTFMKIKVRAPASLVCVCVCQLFSSLALNLICSLIRSVCFTAKSRQSRKKRRSNAQACLMTAVWVCEKHKKKIKKRFKWTSTCSQSGPEQPNASQMPKWCLIVFVCLWLRWAARAWPQFDFSNSHKYLCLKSTSVCSSIYTLWKRLPKGTYAVKQNLVLKN